MLMASQYADDSFYILMAPYISESSAEALREKKYGYMVGFKDGEIVPVPLGEVAGKLKMVDPDSSIIKEAKGLGICFGD